MYMYIYIYIYFLRIKSWIYLTIFNNTEDTTDNSQNSNTFCSNIRRMDIICFLVYSIYLLVLG